MPEVTGVLLAAGQSSRFGSNKLLAEIDHLPLALHAAASLSPCSRLLAVVRRDDFTLHQRLQEVSIELVFNDQAERGMGSSIACGVNASQDSDGWCLLPADMPFVHPSTTQQVVSALQQGAAVAAPYYQGRRGHPVAFSRDMVAELLELDSAAGARVIVEKNSYRLTRIDTDDVAILFDIDTCDDLRECIQQIDN